MTKTAIIEGVLNVLNSPERWTKHVLKAYNEDGEVSYCLLGALTQVCGEWWWSSGHDTEVKEVVRLMDRLAQERGYDAAAHYTHYCPVPGQSAVLFNNAVETEYEDMRLFLKEALEQVA